MQKQLNEKMLGMIVFWVCSGIVLAVVTTLFVLPKHRELVKAENKRIAIETEFKTALERLDKRNFLLSVENLAKSQEVYGSFVLDPDKVAESTYELAKEIEGVLGRSFSKKSSSNKAVVKIPNCEKIAMMQAEISWVGGYVDLVRLINKLERNRPIVLIDYFKIKRLEENPAEFDTSMSVIILIDQSDGDVLELSGEATIKT